MRVIVLPVLCMCAVMSAMAPLPILEQRLEDRPVDFYPLSDGPGRARNYLFNLHSGAFILRMFDAEGDLQQRDAELRVTTAVGELGIAPSVVCGDPDERWLVLQYLEGRHVEANDLREPHSLHVLMSTLRRLHHAPWSVVNGRTLIGRIRERIFLAAHRGVPMPFELPEVLQRLDRLEQMVPRASLAVCHNDLHARNIIVQAGAFWLIDWEDAALGDPFYDIALLAWSLDESPERLLAVYLERSPTLEERERLRQMRLLACLQKFSQIFPTFEPERGSSGARRQRQIELSLHLHFGALPPPSDFWRKFRKNESFEMEELHAIALSCLMVFLQDQVCPYTFVGRGLERSEDVFGRAMVHVGAQPANMSFFDNTPVGRRGGACRGFAFNGSG